MIDWRRAEWQYWANRIAGWSLCLFVLLDADEVKWALLYHFPWWDDVMAPVSLLLTGACWFVRKYTDMYRWDL
jgi:hypothetical protein